MLNAFVSAEQNQQHQQHQQHHQDYYANYWLEEDSRKLFQSISEAESALIGDHPPYSVGAPAVYSGLGFHEAVASFSVPGDDYVYPYAAPVAAAQQCSNGSGGGGGGGSGCGDIGGSGGTISKRNSLTPPLQQAAVVAAAAAAAAVAAPLTSHHVQQLSHLCPPFSEEESQLCQRKHPVKTKITRKYQICNSGAV